MKKRLRSNGLRNSRKEKSPSQLISHHLSRLSEAKLVRKAPTTRTWHIGEKNELQLKNRLNYLSGIVKRGSFGSVASQHARNRREVGSISENKTVESVCANFTFTIKYKDQYTVWNNFSIMYLHQMYNYDEYRIMEDGLQVCDSVEPLIQERWQNLIAFENKIVGSKQCNVSVDGFSGENYIIYNDFTVFFIPTEQNFTRQDYAVILGSFAICSAKLSLSCNDFLVRLKHDDQYKIWKNFSISHRNRIYDYREYGINDEEIVEICSSPDRRIQNIWRARNSWEKETIIQGCDRIKAMDPDLYMISRKFVVYYAPTSQQFSRKDYSVIGSKLHICKKLLTPTSLGLTQDDLPICNRSIVDIKYDDQHYDWFWNFSISFKHKVYDYREYRVATEGVKICNSLIQTFSLPGDSATNG